MNEYDVMEECAELLRQVQDKLKSLYSKEEEWNEYMRNEIDSWCTILVL